VRLFADDTALYRRIRTLADSHILQQDLEQLEQWERRWQMSFNAKKCHVLTVTRKRKPVSTSYTLHGEVLQQEDKAKYLGVELTKDLHWGRHFRIQDERTFFLEPSPRRNLLPPKNDAYCDLKVTK
jgi:hypothetical protein